MLPISWAVCSSWVRSHLAMSPAPINVTVPVVCPKTGRATTTAAAHASTTHAAYLAAWLRISTFLNTVLNRFKGTISTSPYPAHGSGFVASYDLPMLASSALQPEDLQQGSDSSSLMQTSHAVKTTPHQRGILGPADSPPRGKEPPQGWPKEVHKDQRPKKHGVFRELATNLILFVEHGRVLAVYLVPVRHLLGMRSTHHGKDNGELGPTRRRPG